LPSRKERRLQRVQRRYKSAVQCTRIHYRYASSGHFIKRCRGRIALFFYWLEHDRGFVAAARIFVCALHVADHVIPFGLVRKPVRRVPAFANECREGIVLLQADAYSKRERSCIRRFHGVRFTIFFSACVVAQNEECSDLPGAVLPCCPQCSNSLFRTAVPDPGQLRHRRPVIA